MKSTLRIPRVLSALLFLLLLSTASSTKAQDSIDPDTTRVQRLNAAREIMASARYCDLITLDETGRPRSRVMDPFAPDDSMVVWLGTNRSSRKVIQIQNDPRVTLHYFVPDEGAYVMIAGTAEIVVDPDMLQQWWKDEWELFYPDRGAYALIKVRPDWLEVISPRHGMQGSKETWEPPVVRF